MINFTSTVPMDNSINFNGTSFTCTDAIATQLLRVLQSAVNDGTAKVGTAATVKADARTAKSADPADKSVKRQLTWVSWHWEPAVSSISGNPVIRVIPENALTGNTIRYKADGWQAAVYGARKVWFRNVGYTLSRQIVWTDDAHNETLQCKGFALQKTDLEQFAKLFKEFCQSHQAIDEAGRWVTPSEEDKADED